MSRTLPVLVLLLTACAVPLASQSPGPARSASTVSSLHCRLPVAPISGGPGFLRFPGGSFEPATDPLAPIAEIGGYFTWTYDWAYSKWLPVMQKDISPDGSRYAYQNNDRILKVVDVGSGTITPIPRSAGWNLIATADDGVYVHAFLGPAWLWFLRYAGGDPVQVSPAGYSYEAIGGGYAYGSMAKDDQTLSQVDLKTGVATKFADPPAEILGFDKSGVPVVGLANSLVLMPAPYQQTVVVPGQRPGFVVGDANGLWFSLLQGIFLRTPDGRVSLVTEMNGNVEGPCR